MLPQSEFEPHMFASAPAPVAIAAITQDRALIGLLRSVVDPSNELILVTSEAELTPHLNSRRVSVALLDSMFIEGDLAALAERLRDTWNDLVLIVVGTAEEQSKVASQITSGVVYRFLHRPVSAPRVRLFVEAALRRHEVENVERTLEQTRPDFSRMEAPRVEVPKVPAGAMKIAIAGVVLAIVALGGWFAFSGGDGAAPPPTAEVVSQDAAPAVDPAGASEAVAEGPVAAETPATPAGEPANARRELPAPVQAESVAERLRDAPAAAASSNAASSTPRPAATAAAAAPARVPRTIESAVEGAPAAPPPSPLLSHEQRLREQLAQAEAALQRGELSSPAGGNAVELFRGALELDPGNTLAKAGLVRVADRLLSAAERALTAGSAEDAKKMVTVAESLTGATARGAFLTMQIEMERERATLTAKRDSDAQDKLEKGATYLRLANARLRSGALVDPREDNARFYLEAARQTVPDDPAVQELSRVLQKELLARAGAAATQGNAAETERWLANADSVGAGRAEMTAIRRLLQENVIGARNAEMAALTQSFNESLAANRLLQPAATSAKSFLLKLINTDAGNAAVASARQGLGLAYLRELRGALARGDIAAADAWVLEAQTISFASADLNAAQSELEAARTQAAQRARVVGANSLARVHYVAPRYPAPPRGKAKIPAGWVELEFTVRTDGSTDDVVVTNSNPRRLFDAVAVNAVEQWRYEPVTRDGKAIDQRAAIRIRFAED
jgi:TonB family protein